MTEDQLIEIVRTTMKAQFAEFIKEMDKRYVNQENANYIAYMQANPGKFQDKF